MSASGFVGFEEISEFDKTATLSTYTVGTSKEKIKYSDFRMLGVSNQKRLVLT